MPLLAGWHFCFMKERTLEILEPSLKKDFVQIPTRVLRNPKVSLQAKGLYATLISYAWYNAECFPGQNRLAKDLGVTVKTIRNYLNELKKQGLLGWEQRGLNRTNMYKLLPIPPSFTCYDTEGKKTTYQEGNSTTFQEGNYTSYKVYEDKVYKGKEYEGLNNGSFTTSTSSIFNNLDISKYDPVSVSTYEYYMTCYENTFGETHPRLKNEQIDTVLNKLTWFRNLDDNDLTLNQYQDMVDRYMTSEFPNKKVDYNINHFATEFIMHNRYWETCYRGYRY